MNVNSFLVDEKVFHFSPLLINTVEKSYINLINIYPIPCFVELSLNSFINPNCSNNFFNLDKTNIELKPLSIEKICLTFNPTLIGIYKCLFNANIKNGEKFIFGIEGEGIIPSIEIDLNGTTLSFGRVLIGTSKDKTITIINNGFINSILNINIPSNSNFLIKNLNLLNEIILKPKEKFNLNISFIPTKTKKSQIEILINIKFNENFLEIINCNGEGFLEEILFDGFNNEESEIYFKDTICGVSQKSTFHMKNISQNDIRFVWMSHSDFIFIPKIGHIKAESSKNITVIFSTEKPIKHNPLKAICQWTKIQLEDSNSIEWDDTMKNIIEKIEPIINNNKNQIKLPQEPKLLTSRRFPNQKLLIKNNENNNFEIIKTYESLIEPNYNIINIKNKDLQIKIFATSDNIKYTLDNSIIEFSPTMMFEKRITYITLFNNSQIKFSFEWNLIKFQSLKNNLNYNCPFNIEPINGTISANKSQKFKIIFSPQEVDEFSGIFQCNIPYLTQLKPPIISINGISKRPLCFFNIETSDYISGGRRLPEFNYSLPLDIKVIEIISNKINFKIIKIIEIINTTSLAYEIDWINIYDYSLNTINCINKHVLMSSGKTIQIPFIFIPNSLKSVESLWLFLIPQYNIKVHVLIVGKVLPVLK